MAEFVHAGRATEACRSINAMCIVFAESEVISATARGVDRAELARGLHDAVVRRAVAMLRRLPLEDEIVFCGDGALNTCLHELVSRALNREVYLPPEPQIVAALGAALSVGPKHSVLKSGRPRCSPCLDRGT
jgi:activator of 2-hydroxyglutaryl-CoA dehydratase